MTDEEQKQIFAQSLRRLFAESGKQQRDMAAKLGIRESVISNWVCGRAMPKLSRLREIADYFGVCWLELIDGKPLCNTVKIPVYGSVPPWMPMSAITDIVGYEEIPEEMIQSAEYMCMQIHGDSMEPRIYDGDVVITRIQKNAESGDIIVVAIAGEDAVCRKIRKREDGIILMSLNSKYAPMYIKNQDIDRIPIKLYGKVVEVRGKMKGLQEIS